MALQKKIKTLYLEVQKAIDFNAGAEEYNLYPAISHRWQDDIRILGAHMTCVHGGDNTALAAIQNGTIHTHGELSLAGERGKGGSILDVNNQSYYHITTTGAGFLCSQVFGDVMFPEGHGIDQDEGDYLYLHAGMFCGMFGAGKHEHSIFCVVYYVER